MASVASVLNHKFLTEYTELRSLICLIIYWVLELLLRFWSYKSHSHNYWMSLALQGRVKGERSWTGRKWLRVEGDSPIQRGFKLQADNKLSHR